MLYYCHSRVYYASSCSIELLLSLPIEPTTLHGDTSEIAMAAGIHLQPPESFSFQTPDE